jgi:L-lactate dehydrogenase complex protein LldE
MTCEERVPMRIALFVTCLTHTLFPATGQAAVTLPERLGHQVEFPEGQTCCGQMHFNSGYRRPPHPAHPGGGLTRDRSPKSAHPSGGAAPPVHPSAAGPV